MKVSVLVPVYNVQKYLNRCMDSICAQTLEDMEILCINDGSTDTCGEILKEYAQKDKRIKVINKQNTGYGHSMNVGLENAQGEYIAIVESDDFVESVMMEELYNKASALSLEVIKSQCYFFEENEGKETNQFCNIVDDMTMDEVFYPKDRSEIFLKMQTLWSSLYKRTFLESNCIHFNETPGASYQDVSFVFQVYACAKTMLLTPKAYYHYRIDNLNSSVKAPNKVFCICDEIDFIWKFLESRKEEDLNGVAARLSFRVLKENYNNLASSYQYALFIRMVEYLHKFEDAGYVEGKLWDKSSEDELKNIISNPNAYFLETAKSFQDDRVFKLSLNQQIAEQAILNRILSENKIVIYGAGKIGMELKEYLLSHGWGKEQITFAVTKIKNNESYEKDGIMNIEDVIHWDKIPMIVLAMKEQWQYECLIYLNKNKVSNIISIDHNLRRAINDCKI